MISLHGAVAATQAATSGNQWQPVATTANGQDSFVTSLAKLGAPEVRQVQLREMGLRLSGLGMVGDGGG